MNGLGRQEMVVTILLFVALTVSCASGGSSQDSLEIHVSRLVDETTKSESRQDRAVRDLQALGSEAVPHIVGYLGDIRPLANDKITLANDTTNAFEDFRHYSPDTVHDILSAVLNQLTGQSFVFVYNGASAQEREDNRRKWIDWCRTEFPEKAASCNGE